MMSNPLRTDAYFLRAMFTDLKFRHHHISSGSIG